MMVERTSGKPLKCLHLDNEGEYTSHEFKSYCSEHGIRHEKTIPGTAKHNDVAERINRTIMEKVWCMVKMATLLKPFWREAFQTTHYLINRSLFVPLGFDIVERKEYKKWGDLNCVLIFFFCMAKLKVKKIEHECENR